MQELQSKSAKFPVSGVQAEDLARRTRNKIAQPGGAR
jgi:hypothetical protein